MKYCLIIALLFHASILFGQLSDKQARKIDLYAYKIDTTQVQNDSLIISLDSISSNAKISRDKIVAVNHFAKSNTSLTIQYYFKDQELILVRVSEQSPQLDDLHNYSDFYFSSGKMFKEYHRHTIRPCMAIPMDKDIYQLYGYNRTFNADFLKKFVIEFLDKIKFQLES